MRADRRGADRTRSSGSHGFSLAEALVALAIGSGVITAYYQALSTGLDLERRAKARAEAAVLADTILDDVGFETRLEPGRREGRTGRGLGWQLSITPGASLAAEGNGPTPSTAGLYTITVDIAGPELGAGYRITTLRAAPGTIR